MIKFEFLWIDLEWNELEWDIEAEVDLLAYKRLIEEYWLKLKWLVQADLAPVVKDNVKPTSIKVIKENISLEIVNVENNLVDKFIEANARTISRGEASVIVFATKNPHKEIIIILDDKKARKVADKNKLNYHGTLWIITELLTSLNIITPDEARSLIKQLKRRGFYIPDIQE